MESINCIKSRRSIRSYTDEKVDRETIKKVVEAAAYAPSWKNTQVSRYIAIDDPAMIDKIADECTSMFIYNGNTIKKAPMIVVVTALKGRSGVEKDGSFTNEREANWLLFDAGCAVQTFCLAAHEYGLGTVIMGIFDNEKLSSILNIPEDREIVNLICVGHPAEEPEAPRRKSVEDLLSFV